jgi:hypothetical protein
MLTQLLKRLPWNLRAMLAVPKSQNAKALALGVSALVKLRNVGLISDLGEAHALSARLLELRSDGGRRDCWGYNFPWQTRTVLVPRGAANLVCTTFVADALLDLCEASGCQDYLRHAAGAARYIAEELYWGNAAGVHALAYPSPNSRVPIHNANLLGASLLCRVGRALGTREFDDVALRIARYSVSRQHGDGSWPYGESAKQNWIDNFHTGYNLGALASIGRSLGTREFEPAIRSGFHFYLNHFFTAEGVARYFHDRTYPIDIHCVAQSIITLTTFRHFSDDIGTRASRVIDWAIRNMWDPSGHFHYRRTRLASNRIPYFRWAQAWMLLALACALEADAVPPQLGSQDLPAVASRGDDHPVAVER